MTIRIKFLSDAVYETEGPGRGPRFSAGQEIDLRDDLAGRWINRGLAAIVTEPVSAVRHEPGPGAMVAAAPVPSNEAAAVVAVTPAPSPPPAPPQPAPAPPQQDAPRSPERAPASVRRP